MHDGKQTPHSSAQAELIKIATDVVNITDEERTQQALGLWEQEKGFAGLVIAVGWLLKASCLKESYSKSRNTILRFISPTCSIPSLCTFETGPISPYLALNIRAYLR